MRSLFVDAVFNFHPNDNIVPYVLVGIGSTTLEFDGGILGSVDDDATSFQAAAGSRFFVGAAKKMAIRVELVRLTEEPMPAEELARTQDYAVGTFRLSLETPMALGQRRGNQLLMDGELEPPDVTVERLRAVTADDIMRVAQRVIGPRQFSLAVVGPSARADELDAILHG